MSDGGYNKDDFARRLRDLREAAGYGGRQQGEFARMLGISVNAYNNYENAGRIPSPADAWKIVSRTGATLDWLYYGERRGLSPELLRNLPPWESKAQTG